MPRLVRFYGGDPMTWLARTPQAVVRAHVVMMERLMAEEAQDGVSVAAVGRVLETEGWVQRQLSRWSRAAGNARATKRPTPGDLASVGIGFHEVTAGV